MADRIIKADSGNDVVIQNNGGTRKIEVTNAGDVEVTGDFKATTVKATNLKANDGTTALVVSDSTGDVEVTGDVKTTTVKATNLKANDGTASLEIADSTGDIGFSGNTNLKIKLPSAGGIYESDGSTEILTESSGAVSLKNTAIDSTVTMSANQAAVKTAINASGSAPIYACRAWVNFNGSGTLAVNASANVSSVTDNGTGDYTVNFTTAMSDTNYCFTTGIQQQDGSYVYDINAPNSGTFTTSALQFETSSQNGATTIRPRDATVTCVAIFR